MATGGAFNVRDGIRARRIHVARNVGVDFLLQPQHAFPERSGPVVSGKLIIGGEQSIAIGER